jgi:predicted RNase H-like nuclease
MRSVLGIDAAWTPNRPSGVALATECADGWRLLAAEASYQRFQDRADGHLFAGPALDSPPNPRAVLIAASSLLNGNSVDLVAVDIPLARQPIVGRRASDDAVSRAYGARKCGTHTPNASRPGCISVEFREGFEKAGYPLRIRTIEPPGLIEVYPHPALVELSGASERLQYKASRVRSYWPSDTPAERRSRLYCQWSKIVSLLENEIAGVAERMPVPEPSATSIEIKAYEDTLDAIVCAWVAICALERRAEPFGGEDSAIWIPIRN